jgi:HEAT repeat protein
MAKLAANPFAQPDVRMREMERLLQDGSAAALGGVLRRFAANAQGHIADEEEKKWLEDALVDVGEPAIAPVRAYIVSGQKLTYALRVYRRLVGEGDAVAFFLQTLEGYGPEDHRSSEAKLQLISQLAESASDPRVGPGLVPFLADHSDDVCWAALDVIEKMTATGSLSAASEAGARAHLVKAVTEEDAVSQRIAQRVAAFLAAHKWPLPTADMPFVSGLRDSFTVDKAGRLHARSAK